MTQKSSQLVAARIRELRLAAGLTQEQLAERMGGPTPASTISRYERGVFPPTFEAIDRICTAVRVSPAVFFAEMSGRKENTQHPELRQIFDLLLQLSPAHLRIVRRLLRAYMAGVKLG